MKTKKLKNKIFFMSAEIELTLAARIILIINLS